MKCRHVADLLPRLVEEELDELTAEKVREHVRTCKTCAADMSEYQTALAALKRPHEMASPPEALNVLRLPEAGRMASLWTRGALAACGAAVVLAFLLVFPRLRQPEPPQQPAVRVSGSLHEAALPPQRPAAPMASGHIAIRNRRHAASPIHPHGRVRTSPNVRPERPDIAVAAQEQLRPPEPRYPQIIVVAYQSPPEKSSIEIRCVNEVTGETTTYHEISDSNGGRAVVESRSVARTGSNRSVEL